MKYAVSALSICGSLWLGGCADPDTTSPELSIQNMTPAPTTIELCGTTEPNAVPISSNDTLRFDLVLADDQGLSQYKIDLHSNFDCHGHARVATTDWYVIDIVDVSGTDATIPVSIPVPSDVTAGAYHFAVQATDEAGNDARSAIFSLVVLNATDTVPPTLNITAPGNEITVLKGSALQFTGTVEDNMPLGTDENGRVEIRYRQSGTSSFTTLTTETFSETVSTTFQLNLSAVIPSTLASGAYTFDVRAYDAVNNPSEFYVINATVE